MRPIDHRTAGRVQAHIFVAALAFLLHRAIEKNLKAAGLDLSSTEALQALRSVRVVDFTAAGQRKRSVTRGTDRAARVLPRNHCTRSSHPARDGRHDHVVTNEASRLNNVRNLWREKGNMG
jgi:hypothetical protein